MRIIDRASNTFVSDERFARDHGLSVSIFRRWAENNLPLTDAYTTGKRSYETRVCADLVCCLPDIYAYQAAERERVASGLRQRAAEARAQKAALRQQRGVSTNEAPKKAQRMRVSKQQMQAFAERQKRIEEKLDRLLGELMGPAKSNGIGSLEIRQ